MKKVIIKTIIAWTGVLLMSAGVVWYLVYSFIHPDDTAMRIILSCPQTIICATIGWIISMIGIKI